MPLWNSVKRFRVLARRVRERLRIHAAQLRDKAADVRDVARIVAPSANRLRREVRAVRLDHQTVERHIPRHLVKMNGALERHRAGEGDHAVKVHVDLRALPAGRAAVHHALG